MNELFEVLHLPPDREVEKILRLLIRIGCEMLHADEGSLLLYDPATKDLVFAMTDGDSEPSLIGQRLAVGSGISGMAAQTGELQIGAKDQMSKVPGDGTPQCVIAAPMMIDDELLGVLTLVSFAPERVFTLSEGEFYLKLAAVAAVVIRQQQRLFTALPPELREIAKQPEKLTVLADILRNLERLSQR